MPAGTRSAPISARFFVAGLLERGQKVPLQGADARKLALVLRKRSGDSIELIDSGGNRFTAQLDIQASSVVARVQSLIPPQRAAPRIALSVAQALPKAQKMDFIVEKLCELGVAEVVPFESERTIATDTGASKLERWRRIARTAAQQCGRDDLLRVADPVRWETLLATFDAYEVVLVPWELAPRIPLRESLPALVAGVRRALVVVGPEGGFSHAEIEDARAAGGHVISLGERILRTETAATVLVAAVEYQLGEL